MGLVLFRELADAEAFRGRFFAVYGPGLEPFELPERTMGDFLVEMFLDLYGHGEHVTHAALFPPDGAAEGRDPQIEIVPLRRFAEGLRDGER